MSDWRQKDPRDHAAREGRLEQARGLCRMRNEIAQLRTIEDHFLRERDVDASAELEDVIGSARESIRKLEAHIAALLRRRE